MKTETREQVADLLLWSDENARNLIEKIAAEHGVSPDALADFGGMGARATGTDPQTRHDRSIR